MLILPNNCSASEPAVIPKNWQTCGRSAMLKPWRIQYYFRDPAFKDRYPYGKLCAVKGMNHITNLEERREAVRVILENEIYMLKVEGFNPITGTYAGQDQDSVYGIHPNTVFIEAIEAAFNELALAPKTVKDIGYVKKHLIKSIKKMRYADLRIADVKRVHIRAVLETLAEDRGYSPKRYNKARAYCLMIFKELLNRDAIEINPVQGVPKKKTVKRIREVLTSEDLEKVRELLSVKYPAFWRYIQIFYYSGARSSELLSVRREDVDLKRQVFKVTIKKGRQYTEEERAINYKILPEWVQLCKGAPPGHYLFSAGLVPGPVMIDPWQVSKRWKVHVKDKLGITADFYSLKHLHTTRVIQAYGAELAAGINGHKSGVMNAQHYDVLKESRALEEAKKIDISL